MKGLDDAYVSIDVIKGKTDSRYEMRMENSHLMMIVCDILFCYAAGVSG